jgi:hypothetical protein
MKPLSNISIKGKRASKTKRANLGYYYIAYIDMRCLRTEILGYF